MIPKEVLKKVRKIQITTTRKVMDVFAGRYQSVFKGSGMEFNEVREYNPGDEIRSIDWNVTARMGHPFVKKFIEERELTIIFLLDVSSSCRFGTRTRLKRDTAAELCSAIAFSAINNNDKVGMITFTDRVEEFIPARKGVKHVLRVIRESLYNEPKGIGTDINQALNYLNTVVKRRAVVFIVSDFIAGDFKKTLSAANSRHDVIAVRVKDPAEESIPDVGIINVHDAETGKNFVLDTSNPRIQKFYNKGSHEVQEKVKDIFKSAGVDVIEINTNESYVDPLVKFFRLRERKKR
ncbi:MAG: DUF58 domain-containing protein, partial [Candidatus Omnitrophica bacterium]|nr:DUF58 domain-containing protein [Candidatus Omnitrophota bacterium]